VWLFTWSRNALHGILPVQSGSYFLQICTVVKLYMDSAESWEGLEGR